MSNPPASVGAPLSLSPSKGQAYFLVLRFLSFFRLSFYVAHKVRLIWLLCSSEKSLCAVQVATELPSRQEVTRGDRLAPKPFAPFSTTTPSLRHLFPETAWQCLLKLFLMQYFGMWSSEDGQAMCQKRGGAVLKQSRHYLSEQSAVFAKKRVISRPKLSTTLSLYPAFP